MIEIMNYGSWGSLVCCFITLYWTDLDLVWWLTQQQWRLCMPVACRAPLGAKSMTYIWDYMQGQDCNMITKHRALVRSPPTMYVMPLKPCAKITKPFAYDQGHLVGVVRSIHLCSNLPEPCLFNFLHQQEAYSVLARSSQKPCRRQLNIKVCHSESTILVILLSLFTWQLKDSSNTHRMNHTLQKWFAWYTLNSLRSRAVVGLHLFA